MSLSHTLTMRAGQTGRLSFDISPAGDYALVGAVRSCGGCPVAMEQRGADLYIPAGLAPGLYLLEVRADGRTILYGGLEILASPLAEEVGESEWHVEADLSEEVAHITLTLEEGPAGPAGERGPAGPQGEPGLPGEPGAPGKGAYELWLEAGNSGSPEDYLATLRPTAADIREAVDTDLFLPEEETLSTPEGSDNANMTDLELDARHVPVGLLSRIDLRARSNGNNPSTYSYLGLWEQSEDGASWQCLGVSRNAPGQFTGQDTIWYFDDIPLHGRPLRMLAMAGQEAVWSVGNKLGARTIATPAGDSSHIHYNGLAYSYLPQLTLHYRRPREIYAPIEHAADTTVHLSEEEHAWLQEQRLHGSSNPVFSNYITVGYFDRLPQESPGALDAAADMCLNATINQGSGLGTLYVWFGDKPSDVFLWYLWSRHADVLSAFHYFTLPLTARHSGGELEEPPPLTHADGTKEYTDGRVELPGGTMELPGGTACHPDGTRELPGGTNERPAGTAFFPDGTVELPGGTRDLPAGTSFFPDGTREDPLGTRFLFDQGEVHYPNGTVERRGGTMERPGGTIELPGGTMERPGGTMELPGGTREGPLGTNERPTGTALFPSGTMELPGGTKEYHRGTNELPDGTKEYSSGTVELPGGTNERPGGTAFFPDGTRENPLGTQFIPNSGEVYYPNGTTEQRGGTKYYPHCTMELPGGTIVLP